MCANNVVAGSGPVPTASDGAGAEVPHPATTSATSNAATRRRTIAPGYFTAIATRPRRAGPQAWGVPFAAVYSGLNGAAPPAEGRTIVPSFRALQPSMLRPPNRRTPDLDASSIHVPVARAMVDCGVYADGRRIPG